MKTEFLKELGLSEEQIKSVMTENGKDVEKEKAKTIEANAKLEDINNQLETANTTIKDLKKNNADNEALQTKVTEYEDQIKTLKADYDAKVRNMTLNSAIEKALTNAKAKHSDLLSSKIDKEKLIVNADGTVTGIDEQLTGLKESYKDLFAEDTSPEPVPTFSKPTGGNPPAQGMTYTKEQIQGMSTKEINEHWVDVQNSLKNIN